MWCSLVTCSRKASFRTLGKTCALSTRYFVRSYDAPVVRLSLLLRSKLPSIWFYLRTTLIGTMLCFGFSSTSSVYRYDCAVCARFFSKTCLFSRSFNSIKHGWCRCVLVIYLVKPVLDSHLSLRCVPKWLFWLTTCNTTCRFALCQTNIMIAEACCFRWTSLTCSTKISFARLVRFFNCERFFGLFFWQS